VIAPCRRLRLPVTNDPPAPFCAELRGSPYGHAAHLRIATAHRIDRHGQAKRRLVQPLLAAQAVDYLAHHDGPRLRSHDFGDVVRTAYRLLEAGRKQAGPAFALLCGEVNAPPPGPPPPL